MIVQDDKREQIIEVTLKRFSHFGINKTTLNDIAEDMSMSKQSLYYYFPDKSALIIAVVRKIVEEYTQAIQSLMQGSWQVEEVLLEIADVRRNFMAKYFMLHFGDGIMEPKTFDKPILAIIKEVREEQRAMVHQVFSGAVDREEYGQEVTKAQVDLLTDSLEGLACGVLSEREFYMEESMLDPVIEKQKNLIRLFLNGLKYQAHGR